MKRSEFIKILLDSFIKHMNPNGPANSDEEMFSLILQDLDDAGMRIPVTGSIASQMAAVHNQWEEDPKQELVDQAQELGLGYGDDE